jgi:phage terminase large subunit-like protein
MSIRQELKRISKRAGCDSTQPRLRVGREAAIDSDAHLHLEQDRLSLYRPYSKQAEFHTAGAAHRERLFMAGNQLGKTLAGAMEEAIHATGRYPDWWRGRRFAGPTTSWAAGITGESTRDNVQRLLLGRAGELGTGTLPRDAVAKTVPARGAAGLVDTILVRHVSGGVSRIALKSYEKGRGKWQGETLDRVWVLGGMLGLGYYRTREKEAGITR